MPAKLTRRKVIQAKIEAAAGTKETLTATDVIFSYDPSFDSDIDVPERQSSGTLGTIQRFSGLRKAKASFKVEVAGKGSVGVPSWASLLFPAAGFKVTSQTYTPTSDATQHKTLTHALYEDGIVKTLIGGVVQKFSFDAEVGKPCYASVDLVGVYDSVADAAYPTLPAIPPVPPKLASATLTWNSVAQQASKVSVAIENEVTYREDPSKASGISHCQIVGRKITISLDPEAVSVATQDLFGAMVANTEAAFSLALNGGTNNTITFSATKAQIVDISEGERDGKLIHNITLSINDSTSADDGLSVIFA